MILQLQKKCKRLSGSPVCTECTQDPKLTGLADPGVTRRERENGRKPPPTTPAAAPGYRRPPASTTPAPADQQRLSRMVSEQDQYAARTRALRPPSGRSCSAETGVAHFMAMDSQACSTSTALKGPPRSPPLHLPPSCWGRVHPEAKGSRGTSSTDVRQATVPPVPTEAPRRHPGSLSRSPGAHQQAAPTCR